MDWNDINNWACCSRDNPCSVGGGDCDSHSECKGSLRCGVNNCWRDFSGNGANWDRTVDCCYGKVKEKYDTLKLTFTDIIIEKLFIIDF